MVSSHRGPFAGDATYVPYPRRSADPWDPSSQFIRQSNLFEYFIWFSSCCPFQMISSDGRLSFTTKPCRVNSIWTRACYIIHNHNCNHRLLVKEQTTDKCLMKFLESNLLFWSNNGMLDSGRFACIPGWHTSLACSTMRSPLTGDEGLIRSGCTLIAQLR